MKAPLIGRGSKNSVILCKLEVAQEGLDRSPIFQSILSAFQDP